MNIINHYLYERSNNEDINFHLFDTTNNRKISFEVADVILSDMRSKCIEELDAEIRDYHIIPILPLLSKEDILNGYGYRKLKGISFDLYTPSQFNKERINTFLQVFKKYYDFQNDLIKL